MRQSISRTLRTYPWRHQILCVLPLCLLLCFLAVSAGTGKELTIFFKDLRAQSPVFKQVMCFLTDWTNIGLYLVYLGILIPGLLHGDRRQVRFVLVFITVQILVAGILVHLVKMTVGRARPLPTLNGAEPFVLFSTNNAFHSFPSGHTTEAVGAASPLANFFAKPGYSLLLGLIVAIVGFSRIFLSMHHISDVAGGIAVGVLAGLLNHHLCNRE